MSGTGRLGAVLAGGRSTRFGSDKREARFRGQTLLFRAARVLAAVCGEVIVVGGERELRALISETFPAAPRSSGPASGQLALPDAVPDRHGGIGPLGGLHSALVEAREREFRGVIALGCDMPLVTSELLEVIARQGESTDRPAAAIPKAAAGTKGFHPLCAWYSVNSLPIVESRIRGTDHSLQGLLRELDPHRIPESALVGLGNETLMLRSANTPEDLQALDREGGSPF